MKKTHPFWNLKNKTKSWKKIETDSQCWSLWEEGKRGSIMNPLTKNVNSA